MKKEIDNEIVYKTKKRNETIIRKSAFETKWFVCSKVYDKDELQELKEAIDDILSSNN